MAEGLNGGMTVNPQILKDRITERANDGKSSEILKDGMTEYQPKS